MSSEAPSTDTSKAAEGTHQPDTEVHLERVVVRKWRPAIALAALTVVAFVLTVGFGTDESTTFSFAKGSDFFSIPAVALGVRVHRHRVDACHGGDHWHRRLAHPRPQARLGLAVRRVRRLLRGRFPHLGRVWQPVLVHRPHDLDGRPVGAPDLRCPRRRDL